MQTTNTTNGRGRLVAPRPTITLAGVPVALHRIGAGTIRDLRQQAQAAMRDQRPAPPIVTAGEITEPNHADPDYQQALKAYDAAVETAATRRILDYVALSVVEVEVDAEAVAHYRASRQRFGLPIRVDGDYPDFDPADRDRMIYVVDILIDSAPRSDTAPLIQWIYGGVLPHEAEVRDAVESFRDPVGGAAAAPGDSPAPTVPRRVHDDGRDGE